MKRDLSAFEQNLVSAMDEHAHSAAPPAFDATRIVATERRRLRVRISLATVSLATAAGIAACVATTAGGPTYNKVPVVGGTQAPGTGTPSVVSPTTGSSSGLVVAYYHYHYYIYKRSNTNNCSILFSFSSSGPFGISAALIIRSCNLSMQSSIFLDCERVN